jgi:hypothetical protein
VDLAQTLINFAIIFVNKGKNPDDSRENFPSTKLHDIGKIDKI